MNHIKNFDTFINESNLPDLKVSVEELLKPFEEDLDIYRTFEMESTVISVNDNINKLYNNAIFNKSLSKKKLKKGKLQDTKDNETLLDDNFVLRFFFVYDKDAIELEEPKYVLIQSYNKEKDTSSKIMLFKNHNNISDFYQKLTDASIEIERGKKSLVYNTSNSGNNWELKNTKLSKGKFKPSVDHDEMKKIIKGKKIQVQQ